MNKVEERKTKGWFGFFSNFKLLLKFINIGDIRKSLVLILLISIFVSVISPVTTYLSKKIVDIITTAVKESSYNYIFHKAISMIVIILSINLLILMINLLKDRVSMKIGIKASKAMNKIIMDKISMIYRDELENPEIYNLISRVKGKLGAGCHASMLSIIGIMSNIIAIFTFGILIANIKWYFAVIIVASNIFYIIVASKNSFEHYFLELKQSGDMRKLDYMRYLFLDRTYNKEIRSFGLADFLIDKFKNLHKKLQKQLLKQMVKQKLLSSAFWIFSKFGLFICMLILGNMIIRREATLGDFILILSASGSFTGSFTGAVSGLSNINMQLVYLEDWTDFINLPEEKQTDEYVNEKFDIEFDNVSFAYPAADKDVIKNISCKINCGEVIALVGENGSGKTTFINLVLGLFRPRNGKVLIGGKSVEDVLVHYRKHISCIFQNFGKYQMSVIDNLRLANDSIDVDTIKSKVAMLDFVDDLPNGYETYLGQLDKGGAELSGGQWQRIAIQRAFLRPDTSLIIMDEPTASLDPITESELYEEFKSMVKGKTAIITSHRLGSCILADRIFVFSKGEIIEQGSHDELMMLYGKYYEMYNKQRSLYSDASGEKHNCVSF